jgi:hypothetical protein
MKVASIEIANIIVPPGKGLSLFSFSLSLPLVIWLPRTLCKIITTKEKQRNGQVKLSFPSPSSISVLLSTELVIFALTHFSFTRAPGKKSSAVAAVGADMD